MKDSHRLEYRYGQVKDGQAHVSVNIADSYDKKLSTANELADVLRRCIPFHHKIAREPRIVILGGDRRKKMLAIEMDVSFQISDSEAVAMLRQCNFTEGMELSLG
jgi:dsDNA-binding SOS-regulon protein